MGGKITLMQQLVPRLFLLLANANLFNRARKGVIPNTHQSGGIRELLDADNRFSWNICSAAQHSPRLLLLILLLESRPIKIGTYCRIRFNGKSNQTIGDALTVEEKMAHTGLHLDEWGTFYFLSSLLFHKKWKYFLFVTNEKGENQKRDVEIGSGRYGVVLNWI